MARRRYREAGRGPRLNKPDHANTGEKKRNTDEPRRGHGALWQPEPATPVDEDGSDLLAGNCEPDRRGGPDRLSR